MKCLWKNIEWHLPDIPEKQLKWTLFHENFKITNKMFMNFLQHMRLNNYTIQPRIQKSRNYEELMKRLNDKIAWFFRRQRSAV